MKLWAWSRRHQLAADTLFAAFFVVADTGNTLGGGSWWPAHPGSLAWAMLALQALADASLFFRRRAPMAVIGILAAFSLALALLISPLACWSPASPAWCGRPTGPSWPPMGRSTTGRTGASRSPRWAC